MFRKALPKGRSLPTDYGKKKRLFTYFQAIFLSFYSADLYVDVRHRWRGVGALYLLLLSAILTLPWSIKLLYEQAEYYQHVLLPAFKKLPTLKIENGTVQFDKPEPYMINDPKTGKPLIIIDTTGKIADISQDSYPSAVMLFSKHSMTTRLEYLPPYTQVLSEKLEGEINAKGVLNILEWGKKIFVYSIYPTCFMVFFSAIYTLFCMFAFVMSMFSKILLKYDINYFDTLRLIAVSSTPELFIIILSKIINWEPPSLGILLFCLFWGYFILAIRANKYASKHLIVL